MITLHFVIKHFSKIFLTLILLYSPTLAQWSFSLSTEQEYNSNPFKSPIATKSLISSLNLGVENNSENFSIGYYGTYFNIGEITERNFYWHQFAIWKDFENSSLGIYAEQRLNRELYSYFDYSNLTAYYNSTFQLEDFHFSFAPNASLTKYNNISILDNLKGSLSFQVNRGFESETTLILGGSANYKLYLNPSQNSTYSFLDASNNLITETVTEKNISSIFQLLSYIRVAQSITERTGIASQFTHRNIPSKIGNQYKVLNLAYGDESEIFDDPVNSEGNNLSFELTQIIFNDMTIKAGYYLNNKSYPSQGIYDKDSNYDITQIRFDNQRIFNLSINKSFSLGGNDEYTFSLGLNYQLIKNKSNSYWFNYDSNSININFGLEL